MKKLSTWKNWSTTGIKARGSENFLSEVEKAAAENPAKKTENFQIGFWAHAYADSIDPIHLTFNPSPGPDNNEP
jgi:hypothetical protein